MDMTTIEPPFHPFQDLADELLPHAFDVDDGSHDVGHLVRVWRAVRRIMAVEGGDGEILLASSILHDSVHVEKNSPNRSKASLAAADKATSILEGLGWQKSRIERVAHAIEAHSYSAGVEPLTLEAMILRDADRLDGLGLVGVARCFLVSGRIGRALYDHADPRGESRTHDDMAYTLDHFPVKLLKLRDGFLTAEGRRIAEARHAAVEDFYDRFLEEIA
jgi:uncharacterized protein